MILQELQFRKLNAVKDDVQIAVVRDGVSASIDVKALVRILNKYETVLKYLHLFFSSITLTIHLYLAPCSHIVGQYFGS